MTGPLVVLGDALLDLDLIGRATRLSPDAPVPVVEDAEERARPGGAALAARLAALDGRDVVLVAPLADDDAAARLRTLLAPHLRLVAVPWTGRTPVKTRVRVDGQSLLRIDRGGALGQVGQLPGEAVAALAGAGAILVADYGRGATSAPHLRAALAGSSGHRVPVVWDPHPRGAAPLPGIPLVTPNRGEAAAFAASIRGGPSRGSGLSAARADAEALVAGWEVGAVAVTLGAGGALLSYGQGAPMVLPAPAVAVGDPCGAGDRFGATAAGLLADGALPSEAVQGAVVAASAFVAAGGAAAVAGPVAGPVASPPTHRTAGSRASAYAAAGGWGAEGVLSRVRAAGGTVVATGGCFDLLHAGHVATLRAARALGSCLVVCLNSDASVRRLKGDERPLQRQEDRARVLEALECVDVVVVFDEDTPETVLDRLRPDVWAKGGDYAGVELPESRLLQSWGGQAVVLPYLDGRSTTSLVAAARTTVRKESS